MRLMRSVWYSRSASGNAYLISTWYDLHKDLYAVMKIERWGAYVILCLIIGVAMFNVLGSSDDECPDERERHRGASRDGGDKVGNQTNLPSGGSPGWDYWNGHRSTVFGLFICFLQTTYHLIPLDPAVYIIPAIPVEVDWNDVITIFVTSVVFNAMASTDPGEQGRETCCRRRRTMGMNMTKRKNQESIIRVENVEKSFPVARNGTRNNESPGSSPRGYA